MGSRGASSGRSSGGGAGVQAAPTALTARQVAAQERVKKLEDRFRSAMKSQYTSPAAGKAIREMFSLQTLKDAENYLNNSKLTKSQLQEIASGLNARRSSYTSMTRKERIGSIVSVLRDYAMTRLEARGE